MSCDMWHVTCRTAPFLSSTISERGNLWERYKIYMIFFNGIFWIFDSFGFFKFFLDFLDFLRSLIFLDFFYDFFWVSGFLDFFGIFFRFLHCFRIFLDFLCLHLAFIFGVLTFGLWIYISPLTSPERGRRVALNGPIKGPRW